MKQAFLKAYNFYVKNAEIIGALFIAIPNIAWFLITFSTGFREVYILRLILALLIGCPIAAKLNRYGINLWIMKHSLNKTNYIDGLLIGSSVGLGMSILPTLATFINSSGIEQAKTIVLSVWIGATILGAIIGGILGIIAKLNLSQKEAIDYTKKY